MAAWFVRVVRLPPHSCFLGGVVGTLMSLLVPSCEAQDAVMGLAVVVNIGIETTADVDVVDGCSR